MYNENKDLLFNVWLDSAKDDTYKATMPPGFEIDYTINPGQIVEFPTEMGISGFAYNNDALCFVNGFEFEDKTFENPPRVFSLKQSKLTPFGQSIFAKYLTVDYPFDAKIDNLGRVEAIDNLAIVSIQDEDEKGLRPVGAYQLVNMENYITQEDLNRLYYLRKLIGGQSRKAILIEETFRTLVSICLKDELNQ